MTRMLVRTEIPAGRAEPNRAQKATRFQVDKLETNLSGNPQSPVSNARAGLGTRATDFVFAGNLRPGGPTPFKTKDVNRPVTTVGSAADRQREERLGPI